jgi:hypothetical protein
VRRLSDVVGEWRVAGTSHGALSQPFGIAASIRDGRIRFVSQCITLAWNLDLSNGRVVTRTVDNAVPNCARVLTLDEVMVHKAMSAATNAYRLPSGVLVFSGPGGEVILFTQ